MDKGLSRLDQSRRDKLPVVIPKGRIRPVSPLTAARFATECNNAIKNHVPVRSHWSKYKGDTKLLSDYYDRISVSTSCKLPPPPTAMFI